jgi:hypothetical protein
MGEEWCNSVFSVIKQHFKICLRNNLWDSFVLSQCKLKKQLVFILL